MPIYRPFQSILLRIYFTKADHHKPPMLYECLLPMILPSNDVRKQTDELLDALRSAFATVFHAILPF